MGSFIATECKFKNENRTESTYNTTNIPHIPQYMHKYDRVGHSGWVYMSYIYPPDRRLLTYIPRVYI